MMTKHMIKKWELSSMTTMFYKNIKTVKEEWLPSIKNNASRIPSVRVPVAAEDRSKTARAHKEVARFEGWSLTILLLAPYQNHQQTEYVISDTRTSHKY